MGGARPASSGRRRPSRRRLKDILTGTRLMPQQAFQQQFPMLDGSLFYETDCL